jgi:hypothetical protein
MSFNVWGGGGNEGKGVEETVAVIKAARADIIEYRKSGWSLILAFQRYARPLAPLLPKKLPWDCGLLLL